MEKVKGVIVETTKGKNTHFYVTVDIIDNIVIIENEQNKDIYNIDYVISLEIVK